MIRTVHEDQHTFMIIFAHFFIKWEMLHTKVAEKIKAHIVY